MATYEMQATLKISFKADSASPESALEKAVQDRDYEVISAHLDKVQPEGYISIADLARKLGYASPAYIRRKCIDGTIPGAKKTGRDWYIPANTDYFTTDHRETSGRKYAGWRQKYGKGRTADYQPDSQEE